MKSIVNYGLFATALATAALLGHTFTERGYNLKAEQLATQAKNMAELKENSRPSERYTSAHNVAVAQTASAERGSGLSPGAAAADPLSAGSNKASQQTAKMPVAQRPGLSPAEPMKEREHEQDEKKLSPSGHLEPAFNEAAATAIAAGEMTAGSNRLDTLSESVKSPAPGLDMLAILAPLLKLADGKPLGAEAIENKALLVAVWASWCTSCQRQLQALDELEKRVNNPSLQIIVLAVDEDIEAIARAVARRPIHHSIVILDKNAAEQLQLQALPSIYIADARGKLRSRVNGYGSEEVAIFERQIVALLAEIKIDLEKPAMISNVAVAEVGFN